MKILRIILSAIFVIAGLAYVNFVLLPKPQQAKAVWVVGQQTYSCGNVKVALNPISEATCNANTTSFQSTIKLFSLSGSGAYRVHWKWVQYWCQVDDGTPCYGFNTAPDGSIIPGITHTRVDETEGERGLTGNNAATVTAVSDVITPGSVFPQFSGEACGHYQNDFGFWIASNDNPNTMLCGESVDNTDHVGHFPNNASSCDVSVGNSCVPETHLACQGNACVSLPGAGTNSCTQNPNSCAPAPTHKACVDLACTVVSGAGADQCNTSNDCIPQTHLACQDMACVSVAGAGTNSCQQNSDCFHMACVNEACVQQPGGGQSSCTTNSQCQPPTPTPTTPVTPTATPTPTPVVDCDGDTDGSTSDDIECQNVTPTVTPTATPTPTPSPTPTTGVPTLTPTNTPGCTSNCGNITINISQTQTQTQQQQQQQEVLGASVAPAPTSSSLPSTGSGLDVLGGLIALIPAGLKLRKWK